MSIGDRRLAQDLEYALLNVPTEVFERIRTTVDGEEPIAVGEWIAPNEGGIFCGCLLFDGFTQVRGQAAASDAAYAIRNHDVTDEGAAEILSEFYGVEIEKDPKHWAMKLVQAYDNWAQQEYEELEDAFEIDSLLTDVGRIELRRIFGVVTLARDS